jgi:hypothetical protein
MLLACRLAGLSALEGQYVAIVLVTQSGPSSTVVSGVAHGP